MLELRVIPMSTLRSMAVGCKQAEICLNVCFPIASKGGSYEYKTSYVIRKRSVPCYHYILLLVDKLCNPVHTMHICNSGMHNPCYHAKHKYRAIIIWDYPNVFFFFITDFAYL